MTATFSKSFIGRGHLNARWKIYFYTDLTLHLRILFVFIFFDETYSWQREACFILSNSTILDNLSFGKTLDTTYARVSVPNQLHEWCHRCENLFNVNHL